MLAFFLSPTRKRRWFSLLTGVVLVAGFLGYRYLPRGVPPIPVPGAAPAAGQYPRAAEPNRLVETRHDARYSTRPGVVDWTVVPPFRLNPNEVFIWDGQYNSGTQVDEMLARGVTHLSVVKYADPRIGRYDIPLRHRWGMVLNNHFEGTPAFNGQNVLALTDAQIDAVTDRFVEEYRQRARLRPAEVVLDWVSLDFEWGEGEPARVTKIGAIRRRMATRLRQRHGVRVVECYDTYPVGWHPDQFFSTFSAEWNQLMVDGKPVVQAANNIPYIPLNNWVEEAGKWRQADFYSEPAYQGLRLERKRTNSDWLYRICRAAEVNNRLAPVPGIGYVTHGWAEFGYPREQWGALRPDIMEGLAIWQFMLGGQGIGVWSENVDIGTGGIVRDYYEALLVGLYKISRHNDLRTGARTFYTLPYSLDGGRTWIEEDIFATEKAKRPVVRGLLKGDELLVAACDPTLFEGTRTVRVRFNDWVDEITLRPYQTYLGRATLP
jgi:hypothetical protein